MGKRLRVAYISATSQVGGAEVSLCTLIQGLDRACFEPVCLLPEKGPLYDRLLRLEVDVETIPMETRRRRRPVGFWLSKKKIARWLTRLQPDIVHVNSFWAPELAIPAAVSAGFPVVYHIRDFYDHLDEGRLRAFRQCNLLLCITQCVADAIKRISPDLPLEVVYNAVDIEKFQIAEPVAEIRQRAGWQNAFIVGVASRLSPEKGQETFLKAAGIIARSYPDARFLIVGGSQFSLKEGFEQDIRYRVEQLGLAGKVLFTGFVQNMPDYYKSMDVCVLASDWEPFGRTVIEAMAAGTPVVATMSGGPEEVIENGVNGLLVPPSDPDAMAEAILDLYKRPDLRQSFAKKGVETVRSRFGLEQARQFEAIYRKIVQEKVS